MVWGVIEQRVYHSTVNTVDELKELSTLQLTSGESVSRDVPVQGWYTF